MTFGAIRGDVAVVVLELGGADAERQRTSSARSRTLSCCSVAAMVAVLTFLTKSRA